MTPKWASEMRRDMHLYEITEIEVAARRGLSLSWASRLMRGRASSTPSERRLQRALDELIAEKERRFNGRTEILGR